jgi:MSHA biogenesis protein MshG
MTGSPYVPSFARRMIAAGKDARELGKSCEIVGRHYERNAVYLMKNINTVIEPLLTVVLAAIVLVVALAVFLPMWTMIKVR